MKMPVQILYHQQHQGQMIEVIDDGAYRTLTFNSHLTQSRMSLSDPIMLALPYTRCMMASLLFVEGVSHSKPFHVLMIGLGGGSLAKYLLYHFPLCRMNVVDVDAVMPVLARKFFHLPDDPRLTIDLEDGARFMTRCQKRYDLILLDAYDHSGMVQGIYTESLFAKAHALLTTNGVMAINLIRTNGELFRRIMAIMLERLSWHALRLSVVGTNNEIYFVGPGMDLWKDRQVLDGRVWELEKKLDLDFAWLLHDMNYIESGLSWRRWFGW